MKILKLAICILVAFSMTAEAQIFPQNAREYNPLLHTGQYLLVNTRPAQIGLGSIGVVSPEGQSQSGVSENPASLVSSDHLYDVHASFVPWLKASNGDLINFKTLGGSYRLAKRHAIGFNFTHFDIGKSQFLSFATGDTITYDPRELTFGISYAFRLNDRWSIGGGLKYIHSDLFSKSLSQVIGFDTQILRSVGLDLGVNYRSSQEFANGMALFWQAGLALQNMGPKATHFQNDTQKRFLPAIIRLGGLFGVAKQLDENQRLSLQFLLQLDKLMVPTPCNDCDEDNNGLPDYADKTAFEGMIASFFDDHYGGEDFREIIQKVGFEAAYNWRNTWRLAARTGYHYQHPSKGNLHFLSFGLGVAFKGLYMDMAYVLDRNPGPMDIPQHKKLAVSLGYRQALGATFGHGASTPEMGATPALLP
ncbi:MAG: PorV/PorQ family protein [Bacteroidota bacterium]